MVVGRTGLGLARQVTLPVAGVGSTLHVLYPPIRPRLQYQVIPAEKIKIILTSVGQRPIGPPGASGRRSSGVRLVFPLCRSQPQPSLCLPTNTGLYSTLSPTSSHTDQIRRTDTQLPSIISHTAHSGLDWSLIRNVDWELGVNL